MNKLTTRQITNISIGVALLVICSYIIIPMPIGVPMSLQTFGIFFISLFFNKKLALYTIICYIFIGIIGMPVFSGGTSGIGIIFSYTGGFILGFIPATYFINVFKSNNIYINFILLVIANIIIYICGVIVFMLTLSTTLLDTLYATVFPFIFTDILKIVLALFLENKIKKVIYNEEIN